VTPTRLRADFHAHTYLTDGEESATDMWTAADRLQHRLLAITDHITAADPKPLLDRLHAEAAAFEGEDIQTLVGVEVSMLPPRHIAQVARAARHAGAQIVIVHGETLAEPVPVGTNHAALECNEVDLLAHPGLLTEADAALAKAHGTFLELSGRKIHALANGHVARVALLAGAPVLVDSDAHSTEQLLPLEAARRIAQGAGLTTPQVVAAIERAPAALLKRLGGPH
jgi:putative hydrolase